MSLLCDVKQHIVSVSSLDYYRQIRLNGSKTLTFKENTPICYMYKGVFLKRDVSFDIRFMFQFTNTYY